jgi:hypothetical protein
VATSGSAPRAVPPGIVQVKPGVRFTTIAPAGFAMLSAITRAAALCHADVMITSACDGSHSGPDDPHHRGEAYDLRTHGYPASVRDALLYHVLDLLRGAGEPPATPVPGILRSFATSQFFGFIEDADAENEHLHVQIRKGRAFP